MKNYYQFLTILICYNFNVNVKLTSYNAQRAIILYGSQAHTPKLLQYRPIQYVCNSVTCNSRIEKKIDFKYTIYIKEIIT